MKQTLESPPARTLRQAGRAVALLASLGLAACVSVPMAPLVYGSKTVGGLDIATNTGANPGVSISIGYKRDDLALVPVAVLERKGQADETLKIVTGRDGDGTKPDDGKPGGTPRRSSDAMSVFGSFEGRGMAGSATATTSAQAVAANYFSTGIAAQNLADGVGKAASVAQIRHCFAAVAATVASLDQAERKAYTKKGMDACTEAAASPMTAPPTTK